MLSEKKLLPAVTLRDVDSALFVTEALLKSGLDVMEVTFRTSATVPAITGIVKEFPEMSIGAGTILSSQQLSAAKDAGAQFGLSPGFNDALIDLAGKNNFPFIPGVITPSEIEKARDRNIELLKLFPVNRFGGTDYIKSLQGPYQHTQTQFIPMGGINRSNLKDYLALPSVTAVGGSWLVPGDLVARGQFGKITDIARQSLELANS